MHNLDKYLQESDQSELHPAEIANLLRELGESDFQKSIYKIPNEIIGDVALELPDRYFGDVVELLNVEELSTAVKELESDDHYTHPRRLNTHLGQHVQAIVFA